MYNNKVFVRAFILISIDIIDFLSINYYSIPLTMFDDKISFKLG